MFLRPESLDLMFVNLADVVYNLGGVHLLSKLWWLLATIGSSSAILKELVYRPSGQYKPSVSVGVGLIADNLACKLTHNWDPNRFYCLGSRQT